MQCTRTVAFIIAFFTFTAVVNEKMHGRECGSFCDESSFYSCSPCSPLRPCTWSVQAKGGVSPGFYTDTTKSWLNFAASDYLLPAPSHTQMNKEMGLPWQVGGEIGYNFTCNVMLFTEFNYFQAGKKDTLTVLTFPDDSEVPLILKFQGQKGWNGYFGARYFFERNWFCNKISPFVGFKAGLTHYNVMACHPEALDGTPLDPLDFDLASTTVSAGLQIGFDWLLCDKLHGIFTAEFVATGSRKNNLNDLAELPGLYNNVIGHTGTVVNFPITIGLRYDF